MRRRERTPLAAVLVAGLLLAWPAAWNGYPLVFADTGTYLGQAIRLYLGWDRPPFYSLFLHALHWRITLWPVPLAQGLIAAHLLALSLRALDLPGAVPLLAAAGLLAVGTGLPWFATQLMPDVFTGLLVLALWLLGFAGWRLGRMERVYLLALATLAVAVHLAHLPLAAGLALVGGLLAWRSGGARPALVPVGWMAAPVCLAVLGLVAANAAGHGRAAVSPFGSVFLAARLLDDGPALRTLDARCAKEAWQVCALRDRLPMHANDFLWPPDGPLRGALGGGKAWAAEASAIVAATLASEPAAVARAVAGNGLRQFGMLGTGDGLEPWPAEPGPEALIREHFPAELAAFRAARQYGGALLADARALSPLHVATAWLGLLTLPVLVWLCRRNLPAVALAVFVLAAAAGNAAVTGGLSGPNERYQARIAWLLAFAPAAILPAACLPRRGRGRPLVRHPV
ncbi:hypothetical protein [Falsiroseomonas oryzae]|uniref:hypothetical protein n=1 Tax=Falsiroseomonas oryzae TaxID=2766473 RepID=UPI0022EA321A|nr:hypothetical protein [Roseomonas sp. MO-31]